MICPSQRRVGEGIPGSDGERSFRGVDSLFELPNHHELNTGKSDRERVERVQIHRFSHMFGALLEFSNDAQVMRIEDVRFGIARIEFDGSLPMMPGALPVKMKPGQDRRDDPMRFGQERVQSASLK